MARTTTNMRSFSDILGIYGLKNRGLQDLNVRKGFTAVLTTEPVRRKRAKTFYIDNAHKELKPGKWKQLWDWASIPDELSRRYSASNTWRDAPWSTTADAFAVEDFDWNGHLPFRHFCYLDELYRAIAETRYLLDKLAIEWVWKVACLKDINLDAGSTWRVSPQIDTICAENIRIHPTAKIIVEGDLTIQSETLVGTDPDGAQSTIEVVTDGGARGQDGAAGTDGPSVQDGNDAVCNPFALLLAISSPTPGQDGSNGTDGDPGTAGERGADGGILTIRVGDISNIRITGSGGGGGAGGNGGRGGDGADGGDGGSGSTTFGTDQTWPCFCLGADDAWVRCEGAPGGRGGDGENGGDGGEGGRAPDITVIHTGQATNVTINTYPGTGGRGGDGGLGGDRGRGVRQGGDGARAPDGTNGDPGRPGTDQSTTVGGYVEMVGG